MTLQKHSYVYIHYRIGSGIPFYIGKGSNKKRERSRNNRNRHWRFIVNKDGGFLSNKLIDQVDDEFAYLCEIEAIDVYRKRGYNLVNMTDGGEGHLGYKTRLGVKLSQETKEKLRQANLGKKQSIDTIAKRVETFKKIGYQPVHAIRYGTKNHQYKGGYITPAGVFDTLEQCAKNNGCTIKKVRINLYGNRMQVNGKEYNYPPVQGWRLVKDDHGIA